MYLKLTAAAGDLEAHILLIRLVERVRRAVAFEYGLPLATLSPRQAFVSRILGTTDVASYSQLHCDESSTAAFHYSAVLYLSPRSDYAGGDLLFHEPIGATAQGRRGGEAKRLVPHAGMCAMFSSGWENPHQVAPVTAGTRLVMPIFLTTEPPPGEPPQALRRPSSPEERMQALWRHGLMPESLDDFLVFMQHWHAFLSGPEAEAEY